MLAVLLFTAPHMFTSLSLRYLRLLTTHFPLRLPLSEHTDAIGRRVLIVAGKAQESGELYASRRTGEALPGVVRRDREGPGASGGYWDRRQVGLAVLFVAKKAPELY